ncbi:hypothetical protein AVEN_49685-1 [Araneus ventricosus]|uniref:Uncharacterized protein n=1 Tax=Araneus ventricosus TaxID=182803 RepID=A0A4Y2SQK5_ARAVE|nr:hypothetical protein AVEN_49685-1 [Araneus ventricosus]
MNRRDDGIELKDNDDEEELEEKPPSAQETLQALRTLRRSENEQMFTDKAFDETSVSRLSRQEQVDSNICSSLNGITATSGSVSSVRIVLSRHNASHCSDGFGNS